MELAASCYTGSLSEIVSRAGEWMLASGIQEGSGGVARYFRSDLGKNNPVSTEITGYAVSGYVYLHSLLGDAAYIEAARRAARFLAGAAWHGPSQSMPFEIEPPEFTYFFDCGIIVRGLLAAWRATSEPEFLQAAVAVGNSMAADFADGAGTYHPILALPSKKPLDREPLRWSRAPGCYQLKAAMGLLELAEATGDARYREPYDRTLEFALSTYGSFLPGHSDPAKVMDRLHAFAYFLEGLLPRISDSRCAAALCDGMERLGRHLREIAPEFARSDVYAQLLRIRLYADWYGVAPLDSAAAEFEAGELARYQVNGQERRTHGGFYFGTKNGKALPYVNPVSAMFALQALALHELRSPERIGRHLLI